MVCVGGEGRWVWEVVIVVVVVVVLVDRYQGYAKTQPCEAVAIDWDDVWWMRLRLEL